MRKCPPGRVQLAFSIRVEVSFRDEHCMWTIQVFNNSGRVTVFEIWNKELVRTLGLQNQSSACVLECPFFFKIRCEANWICLIHVSISMANLNFLFQSLMLMHDFKQSMEFIWNATLRMISRNFKIYVRPTVRWFAPSCKAKWTNSITRTTVRATTTQESGNSPRV